MMSFILSQEFLFALRVVFKGFFFGTAFGFAYLTYCFWKFAINEWKKPTDRTLKPPTTREWAAMLVLLIGPPMFFAVFLTLFIKM